MLSYWEQKTFFYHRHLIICGAGFTGLSAAIYFKKMNPQRSVLVLERSPVNGGASTKNAGFACFGSPSELIDDLKVSGEDEVFSLVEKRWRGLQNLKSFLGEECVNYEHKGGYELFKKDDVLFEECAAGLEDLNRHLSAICGKEVYRHSDDKISAFGFAGIEHIIGNIEEGQVDTGKMYAALLQLARETGVDIFNGITVEKYEEGKDVILHTTEGQIMCDRFLIATNGFASGLLQDSQTRPARAQVLITSPVQDLKVCGSFHMDRGYYYFRDIDGRVLFGGGRHLAMKEETTTEMQLNDVIQQHLEKLLREMILPGHSFSIEQRWSGIMGMGNEKQVIRKQLTEKIFCAVRLSGMGLALSSLLGKEVAEMMQ